MLFKKPHDLKNDKEVAMIAINKSYYNLGHAEKMFKMIKKQS